MHSNYYILIALPPICNVFYFVRFLVFPLQYTDKLYLLLVLPPKQDLEEATIHKIFIDVANYLHSHWQHQNIGHHLEEVGHFLAGQTN